MLRPALVALMLGLLFGGITYRFHNSFECAPAGDLTWPLHGAQRLLEGTNPYAQPSPCDWALWYPLPALLVVMPLVSLPPSLAAGIFIGVSTALLVYGIARHGQPWQLLILLAPQYIYAVLTVQWSPLLLASAILGPVSAIAIMKPTIGAALILARPHRQGIGLALGILALSLVLSPTWPLDWLHNVLNHRGLHASPLLQPAGFLLPLALLRWTDWRSRLLVLMACVPQLSSYDSLPLYLIAGSAPQLLLQASIGWLVPLGIIPDGWETAARYLPPLGFVLWPLVSAKWPAVTGIGQRLFSFARSKTHGARRSPTTKQ
ncbi:MAG: hypothetical protein M3R24_10195 [Chloroflexota bacterium]|nr:hypothetical protein [Chloroflexota bacterium]PLS82440.1 MAG: hypothetical protein CYG59_04115 [Chloroflexota bacterium]